jgi:limonene-1,2-epoxide hydrolase
MDRRRFLKVSASVATASVAATGSAAAEPDRLAVLRDVITAWRRKDVEAMLSHIDDDIVWHSHVGSPPLLGKPAMRDFAVKLAAQMSDIRWRIFSAAPDGDRLHVEGVDDFVDSAGRRIVVPYAGVFEFRGPLVFQWRDYFDRNLFDRLKAGESLPPYLTELVDRPALF